MFETSSFVLYALIWLRKSAKFLLRVFVIFSKPRLKLVKSVLNLIISFAKFVVLFELKLEESFCMAIS